MAATARSPLLLVTGVLSLLLGVYLAVGSIGDARQARASQSWPTVQGEVTTFKNELIRRSEEAISRDAGPENIRRETMMILDFEYTYTVDGTTHTGRRATWGGKDRRSIYRLGTEVTVSYDPSDPSVAILQPGSEPDSRAVVTLLLLAVGGYLVYLELSARRRQPSA